jgi:glutamate synthase (NADPH/NADH) small chain
MKRNPPQAESWTLYEVVKTGHRRGGSHMTEEATPKEKKQKKGRVRMPEQEPKVRARNFIEVPTGYTPEMAKEEAARCLQCKNPGCVDGCPVGVDIPGFIKFILESDFT